MKSKSWRTSTHYGVQQGRQRAGHLAKTKHGVYLESIQNIVLQHQGEDPTGVGSLLLLIYSEARDKGNVKVSPGHEFLPYGMRTRHPCVLANPRCY
ncbi:hypothetical protein TNCV_458671 [Trichonephila clavipes]|nr:hypothetical protein TNCV_458671 [Trichonephila clavipes]